MLCAPRTSSTERSFNNAQSIAMMCVMKLLLVLDVLLQSAQWQMTHEPVTQQKPNIKDYSANLSPNFHLPPCELCRTPHREVSLCSEPAPSRVSPRGSPSLSENPAHLCRLAQSEHLRQGACSVRDKQGEKSKLILLSMYFKLYFFVFTYWLYA